MPKCADCGIFDICHEPMKGLDPEVCAHFKPRGIELTCRHCGHTWTYTGKQIYQCTCPRCGYKVRIKYERPRNPDPYVCELSGAEIPEGEAEPLEDGETMLCMACRVKVKGGAG